MKELYVVFGEAGDLDGIDCITSYVDRLTGKCTYFCYANDNEDAIRIVKNAIEFGILPYGRIVAATSAVYTKYDLYGNYKVFTVPHLSFYLGSFEAGPNSKNFKRIAYAPGPWNKDQIYTEAYDESKLN